MFVNIDVRVAKNAHLDSRSLLRPVDIEFSAYAILDGQNMKW